MALHLIIDGYNLIRTSPSLSRQESSGLDMGREALLHRLASYKRIKPSAITVVFDAAQGPHPGQTSERFKGIKAVYSSSGQTADQVIASLARKKGSQALVVTSDQTLARTVENHGATAVSSQEFEDRMEMAFYYDLKGSLGEEEDREPTLSTQKKGPSRRRSKSARRRVARLKKL